MKNASVASRTGLGRRVGALAACAVLLSGATSGAAPPLARAGAPAGRDGTDADAGRRASGGEPRVLSGWFHVIRNGGVRYVLIDDRGRWHHLVVDEALVAPHGGPRQLDRRRVSIVGAPAPDAGVIRVLSLRPE